MPVPRSETSAVPSLPRRFRVRRAVPEDVVGMARVHVETWKRTYRGIVPDDRLDAMTVERDLARGFGSTVRAPPPGHADFVAAREGDGVEGPVIGFAAGHPCRLPATGFTGELGGIYVLPADQRNGIGRALVAAVARHLLGEGHTSMLVWVLAANPYRAFYAKLGGRTVLERTVPVAGTPLPEVAYGWEHIVPLTAPDPT